MTIDALKCQIVGAERGGRWVRMRRVHEKGGEWREERDVRESLS